jgi:hypothetical protein
MSRFLLFWSPHIHPSGVIINDTPVLRQYNIYVAMFVPHCVEPFVVDTVDRDR